MRRGAAHHIPLDVAARSERGKLHLVDSVDRLVQIVLEYAVELQSLAARDPQRAIATFVGQVQLRQQLIARQFPAGNLRADHEHVGLNALAASFASRSGLAIVLLIGAMMLQKLRISLAERIVSVVQLTGDRPAEIVALGLDRLDGAELLDRLVSHSSRSVPLLDFRREQGRPLTGFRKWLL